MSNPFYWKVCLYSSAVITHEDYLLLIEEFVNASYFYYKIYFNDFLAFKNHNSGMKSSRYDVAPVLSEAKE